MKALLITNKYMQSEKFLLLKERFIENAKILNIELDYKNNFEAYELIGERICYDFILFYDKDIKLAKLLEDKGFNVFNKSSAIASQYLIQDFLINLILYVYQYNKNSFNPIFLYG